jgi:hypothetical protein
MHGDVTLLYHCSIFRLFFLSSLWPLRKLPFFPSGIDQSAPRVRYRFLGRSIVESEKGQYKQGSKPNNDRCNLYLPDFSDPGKPNGSGRPVM